ncbi:hypothetical protein D3C75_1299470 [compost metagenome]
MNITDVAFAGFHSAQSRTRQALQAVPVQMANNLPVLIAALHQAGALHVEYRFTRCTFLTCTDIAVQIQLKMRIKLTYKGNIRI